MIGILTKKKMCPIGVDLGSGYLRLAQLGLNDQTPFLQEAAIQQKPEAISPGTPEWQRWAVNTLKSLVRTGHFKGKGIFTALPSDDLFIDQVKIPKSTIDRLAEVVQPKVKKKFPFNADNAVVKYVVAEHADNNSNEVDVIVMATDKENVNRHLAIYEKAGFIVEGISVWPFAMIQSFIRFFNRRANEQDKVSILLDVGTNHSNVIICRGPDLLLARVIKIGFSQLIDGGMTQRLISETDACVKYYENTFGNTQIERLVFLAGSNVEKELCGKVAELAQRLQIPAQIGDVLNAVEIKKGPDCVLDRRNSTVDWAMAFGLSLEGAGSICNQ